jgi:hypothetical protein
MINYATQFPIEYSRNTDDIVSAAIQWITASPHSKIKQESLKIPDNYAEAVVKTGTESVTIGRAAMGKSTISSLQWVQVDGSNLEWTSTIVARKNEFQHLVSVQISCEALSSAALLPLPKKPRIIHKIIKELGGGQDGHIPITDMPFILEDGDEKIAAALIHGTGDNRLPIVYVSKNYRGRYIVFPKTLSKALSGLAHVVVEPSVAFSLKLRQFTGSRNAYGGTIGVYWPDNNMRKLFYINERTTNSDCIQRDIVNHIRIVLSNRRQDPTCSWLYYKEALATINYNNIKESSENKINDYFSTADSEISAKSARIMEQETEIQKLTAEIKRLNSQSQIQNAILNVGEERDYYAGEIHDIILNALTAALMQYPSETRKHHIIKDIIKSNTAVGEATALCSQIKSLLKTYTCMDSKICHALEKLGFKVSDDGKHHKAVFHNDRRYTFSISKTGSDHRGGKNLASDITKKLF